MMTFLIILLVIVLVLPVLGLLAFGIIGAVIALIVGFFMLIVASVIKAFIIPWFSNRDKMRLDSDHKLIIPDRQVVRFDSLNGGYVIDCYHTDPDTGREFVFTSPPFAEDPTARVNGTQLGVFVNPIDYSNYYVDVSKLTDKKDII
ncbi:MAG: hypothetical protein IJ806_01845 [Ruminococcus sp.]|nr:hypothetical protein [Ruminococcus sp.]